MIRFATCYAYADKLEMLCKPGLAASMGAEPYEHDAIASRGDVFAAYAEAMGRAKGAECLVLLHDDLELLDEALASKLRAAFADPSVAVVGLIGSRHAAGLAWWTGERAGRVTDDLVGLHDFGFARLEVDKLDGMMLALSPWAVEHLTLAGLGYEGLHGYADELCAQARKAGKRVIVADITAHHHSRGGYAGGDAAFARAEAHYFERWPFERHLAAVRAAGTDSAAVFPGYAHEGGLYLQQHPREFAALLAMLEGRTCGTMLEIGVASGGTCKMLADALKPARVVVVDDGKHPRARWQTMLLPQGVERFEGDSHTPEAAAFVGERGPYDVVFIDGDHSYAGASADLAMVLPYCAPHALVIMHDTVACEGVRRAWQETCERGRLRVVKEIRGRERPLGIAVSEAVPRAWDALLKPPPWDVGAMYDAHRGEPVSATPRVMLAVPSYRESYEIASTCNAARQRMVDDLEDHGIGVAICEGRGDSLVQRARQRMMHSFLKSTCTHLLWCDLDIEPVDQECARKMLATGFDVVAGACPFKAPGGRVVFNALEDMGAEVMLSNDCLPVRDAGTGFMLVSRKAIVRMCEAHPELQHWSRSRGEEGEPLWALYDTGVVDGTYESEDFMFCRLWQALGEKVYVHVPSAFRHWGTHGFEGSLVQQLGLEVQP